MRIGSGKTTWIMHSSDTALDFVRRVVARFSDSCGTNNSRGALGIARRFVAMRKFFAPASERPFAMACLRDFTLLRSSEFSAGACAYAHRAPIFEAPRKRFPSN